MGIPLIEGRDFTDGDQDGSPAVAIINQFLAHEWFPDRDAVGQTKPDNPGLTIVGIVKDYKLDCWRPD